MPLAHFLGTGPLRAGFFTLLLCCISIHARADYAPGTGELLFIHGDKYVPATLRDTEIIVDIHGVFASVVFIQHFSNPTREWLNANYVFPLGEKAVVDDFQVKLEDRVIRAEVQEKQQVQQRYQQALQEGKHAGLSAQLKPNLFSLSLANVAPGESVSVALSFEQRLDIKQGQFHFSLPLAVTPRYVNRHLAKKKLPAFMRWNEFPLASLSLNLTPGVATKSLTSSSHTVMPIEQAPGEYHIQLDDVEMNRDFILSWAPVREANPQLSYFEQRLENGEHYGVLMVVPPEPLPHREPREVTFILDTSGSMQDQALAQAVNAIVRAMDNLAPQDSFQIVRFESTASALFTAPQPATLPYLEWAQSYLQGLRAEGGTELGLALNKAMKPTEASDKLRQLVLITDGAIDNEHAVFEQIHEHLGDARLFTVAIGPAPNRYFMREAALFGRGSYTSISDLKEVGDTMSRLFVQLEQMTLTDLALQLDGEVWPKRLPDLFSAEPLIINVKSRERLTQGTLMGSLGGDVWSQSFDIRQVKAAKGLDRLWAREKVDALMAKGVLQGNRSAFKQEVITLGLAHQMVTPYTSMIAIEEYRSRPKSETSRQARLATPALVTGVLPQTASWAVASRYFGLMFLILAAVCWWRSRA